MSEKDKCIEIMEGLLDEFDRYPPYFKNDLRRVIKYINSTPDNGPIDIIDKLGPRYSAL